MNRNVSISRREMLGLLGSGFVVVAGFDPVSRRWLSEAEAAGCPTFTDAPRLDGMLLVDAASRTADARDKGNNILSPGSGIFGGDLDD